MPQSGDRVASSALLVIGLGTTGTAALDTAREAGIDAAGIDLAPAPHDTDSPWRSHGTRAWAVFGDGTVAIAGPRGLARRRPKAIVIATGATDLPLPLSGWELGGVVGAWRGSRELPDGTEVVVLRGPHAGLGGRQPDLTQLDVTLDHDLADGSPVSLHGKAHVESLRISEEIVPTRHVLLDNGLQPENALARMTGLPSVFSTAAGGDAIAQGTVVTLQGTLLAVVGDAAGIGDDEAVMLREARDTGRLLAESVLGGPVPVAIQSGRVGWNTEGWPTLPAQATERTLVCPAEGVTVGMVREAITHGATTVNDVKRRTRAAMAVCQGRDCLWTMRALLAEAGRDVATPMTARPPVAGLTVGELAELADH